MPRPFGLWLGFVLAGCGGLWAVEVPVAFRPPGSKASRKSRRAVRASTGATARARSRTSWWSTGSAKKEWKPSRFGNRRFPARPTAGRPPWSAAWSAAVDTPGRCGRSEPTATRNGRRRACSRWRRGRARRSSQRRFGWCGSTWRRATRRSLPLRVSPLAAHRAAAPPQRDLRRKLPPAAGSSSKGPRSSAVGNEST